MLAMDLLIVVVALPRIQKDLGFNPASLTWVLNAFGLAFGGLLLLATGSLLVAASMLGFALLGDGNGYFPAVLIPLLVHAVGIALVFAPATVAIMHGAPEEHAAAVSGLLQMDQQIGGALGIAVITSIYALATTPGHYVSGFPAAFGGGAIIALVAAIIARRAVRPTPRPHR